MKYILHLEDHVKATMAAIAAVAGHQNKHTRPVCKIGLDVHAQFHVAARQQGQATPEAARRFAPNEFVPWVRTLLAAGQDVHVVYESCGFGFALYRALLAADAKC